MEIAMQAVLAAALIEALNDEFKARATYRLVIQKFGPIRPFVNILASEERHIRALLPLFWKYNIPVPVDEWPQRVTSPESIEAACQAGVAGEIENAEMYRRLLAATRNYPDVQRVFLNLQRASQQNHLQAFQRCADRSASGGPVQSSPSIAVTPETAWITIDLAPSSPAEHWPESAEMVAVAGGGCGQGRYRRGHGSGRGQRWGQRGNRCGC
jgi:hypothetical protein